MQRKTGQFVQSPERPLAPKTASKPLIPGVLHELTGFGGILHFGKLTGLYELTAEMKKGVRAARAYASRQ